MNILPKKSWHVRNKDNIERVRRDEENARLEEEKNAKRAALAEQEARTKLLRDRVKQSFNDDTRASIEKPYDNSEHINLFSAEGSMCATTNRDYEVEKKAEEEKKEKALGILKYLAPSANEDEKPWYIEKSKHVFEDNRKSTKDADCKLRLDPLVKMNALMDQTKQNSKKSKTKQKSHKEKKSGKKSISELRAERMKREKGERLRAEQLLRQDKRISNEDDPYKDGYYSQFNPELARKPRWHRRYDPH